jgi:hypothetical protein
MAQTLESALNVKKKALGDTRRASTQSLLRTFFSHMAQHHAGVDLQLVAVSGTKAADVVLSDVAGKLYALVLRKPAGSVVNSFVHVTDHASVASDGALAMQFKTVESDAKEKAIVFPDGMDFSVGMTLAVDTTVAGSTPSETVDAPVGFAIVGA